MKIGIDIDDTLTNTKELQLIYWKEYVTNNPNPHYTSNLPSNINGFGDKYIATFWDTYREILSFQSSYKKNVSLILHKLLKDGHKLCIVTSRPKESYQNLLPDLKKSFETNDIPITTIYTNVRHKGIFCKSNNIDLLIDDSLNHIIEANDNNIKTILFNKMPSYKGLQTTSWNRVYQLIKKMEK